jgi:hypothetical protein
MFASRPALISRLRRRLAGVAWLFALLVLAKGAIATACAGDGLALVDAAAPAAVVATFDVASNALSDDASDPCWHAGSGGCHCSCVHVTPLAPDAPGVRGIANARVAFAPDGAVERVAPRDDHLRPPIA